MQEHVCWWNGQESVLSRIRKRLKSGSMEWRPAVFTPRQYSCCSPSNHKSASDSDAESLTAYMSMLWVFVLESIRARIERFLISDLRHIGLWEGKVFSRANPKRSRKRDVVRIIFFYNKQNLWLSCPKDKPLYQLCISTLNYVKIHLITDAHWIVCAPPLVLLSIHFNRTQWNYKFASVKFKVIRGYWAKLNVRVY